ncbi:unnamed protein product [Rhizoctonia solani]|uniref:Uncharacterized protein n=1 Tax=Rhizoctonia solani TaxID=456999 RepID=A0A8H3ANJ3_9AGAM|nr:unnamed protein product [Rhizoctonia solani]
MGLSLAAFSNAVEFHFGNMVIEPHGRIVSLLSYYKTTKHERLSTSVPHLIDPKRGLRNDSKTYSALGSSEGSEHNAEASASYLLVPDFDYRRGGLAQPNDPSAASVRAPDYRRDTRVKRSSTHAVAGEHLKAKVRAVN